MYKLNEEYDERLKGFPHRAHANWNENVINLRRVESSLILQSHVARPFLIYLTVWMSEKKNDGVDSYSSLTYKELTDLISRKMPDND